MMCSDDVRVSLNHSGTQVMEMPSDAWRLNDWYISAMYAQMKYSLVYVVGIHA